MNLIYILVLLYSVTTYGALAPMREINPIDEQWVCPLPANDNRKILITAGKSDKRVEGCTVSQYGKEYTRYCISLDFPVLKAIILPAHTDEAKVCVCTHADFIAASKDIVRAPYINLVDDKIVYAEHAAYYYTKERLSHFVQGYVLGWCNWLLLAPQDTQEEVNDLIVSLGIKRADPVAKVIKILQAKPLPVTCLFVNLVALKRAYTKAERIFECIEMPERLRENNKSLFDYCSIQ